MLVRGPVSVSAHAFPLPGGHRRLLEHVVVPRDGRRITVLLDHVTHQSKVCAETAPPGLPPRSRTRPVCEDSFKTSLIIRTASCQPGRSRASRLPPPRESDRAEASTPESLGVVTKQVDAAFYATTTPAARPDAVAVVVPAEPGRRPLGDVRPVRPAGGAPTGPRHHRTGCSTPRTYRPRPVDERIADPRRLLLVRGVGEDEVADAEVGVSAQRRADILGGTRPARSCPHRRRRTGREPCRGSCPARRRARPDRAAAAVRPRGREADDGGCRGVRRHGGDPGLRVPPRLLGRVADQRGDP